MPAETGEVPRRKVRCPTCKSVLVEPPSPIYKCPDCTTLLLAKGTPPNVDIGGSTANQSSRTGEDGEISQQRGQEGIATVNDGYANASNGLLTPDVFQDNYDCPSFKYLKEEPNVCKGPMVLPRKAHAREMNPFSFEILSFHHDRSDESSENSRHGFGSSSSAGSDTDFDFPAPFLASAQAEDVLSSFGKSFHLFLDANDRNATIPMPDQPCFVNDVLQEKTNGFIGKPHHEINPVEQEHACKNAPYFVSRLNLYDEAKVKLSTEPLFVIEVQGMHEFDADTKFPCDDPQGKEKDSVCAFLDETAEQEHACKNAPYFVSRLDLYDEAKVKLSTEPLFVIEVQGMHEFDVDTEFPCDVRQGKEKDSVCAFLDETAEQEHACKNASYVVSRLDLSDEGKVKLSTEPLFVIDVQCMHEFDAEMEVPCDWQGKGKDSVCAFLDEIAENHEANTFRDLGTQTESVSVENASNALDISSSDRPSMSGVFHTSPENVPQSIHIRGLAESGTAEIVRSSILPDKVEMKGSFASKDDCLVQHTSFVEDNVNIHGASTISCPETIIYLDPQKTAPEVNASSLEVSSAKSMELIRHSTQDENAGDLVEIQSIVASNNEITSTKSTASVMQSHPTQDANAVNLVKNHSLVVLDVEISSAKSVASTIMPSHLTQDEDALDLVENQNEGRLQAAMQESHDQARFSAATEELGADSPSDLCATDALRKWTGFDSLNNASIYEWKQSRMGKKQSMEGGDDGESSKVAGFRRTLKGPTPTQWESGFQQQKAFDRGSHHLNVQDWTNKAAGDAQDQSNFNMPLVHTRDGVVNSCSYHATRPVCLLCAKHAPQTGQLQTYCAACYSQPTSIGSHHQYWGTHCSHGFLPPACSLSHELLHTTASQPQHRQQSSKVLQKSKSQKQPKQYPLLPCGASLPYVICQHCNKMLQVPYLPPSKRTTRKLRCGACKRVSKFSIYHDARTKQCSVLASATSPSGQPSTSSFGHSQQFSGQDRIVRKNFPSSTHVGEMQEQNLYSRQVATNAMQDWRCHMVESAHSKIISSLDTGEIVGEPKNVSLQHARPPGYDAYEARHGMVLEGRKSYMYSNFRNGSDNLLPPGTSSSYPWDLSEARQDYGHKKPGKQRHLQQAGITAQLEMSDARASYHTDYMHRDSLNFAPRRFSGDSESTWSPASDSPLYEHVMHDVSLDLEDMAYRKEQDGLKVCEPSALRGKTFFQDLLKKSLRGSTRSEVSHDRRKVIVNGMWIPDDVVKKAEEKAGPISSGSYWYDCQAGFWGVTGGPCLGMVPPFIEELNFPLDKHCSRGSTGVIVNGRELHEKDLHVLTSRGLPFTPGKAYGIDISGRVYDEASRQYVRSLGNLAPTVQKKGRGCGLFQP